MQILVCRYCVTL